MRVCAGGGLGFGFGKKIVGWVPGGGGEAGIFSFFLEHVVREGGPDAPDAAQAPLSGDHALDDFEFEGAGGLNRIDIIRLEFFKEGVVLIGEDERFGGESVLEGV